MQSTEAKSLENSATSIWQFLRSENFAEMMKGDAFWHQYIEQLKSNTEIAVHLMVLSKEYLDLILSGQKTIESRFSINRVIPYKSIYTGDIVLLKPSGGAIVGIGFVSQVWFYQLHQKTLLQIKEEFGEQLQISDQSFWHDRRKAAYATLLRLEHLRSINPIRISKKDRRAWVIFNSPNRTLF